jgi:hypothetical protein
MNFNSFGFHINGVNSKLSDIDYLVGLKYYTGSFKLDFAYPPYFKQNKLIAYITNLLGPVKGGGFRKMYLPALESVL